MPYSIEDLKKKEFYQKIFEADKNELQDFFKDEELRAEISGSTLNAIRTLRDENGFILSYEDPNNIDKTYPSNIMKVRVPINLYTTDKFEVDQKLEKDKKFSNFRPNLATSQDEDIEALRVELQSQIAAADDRERLARDKETELQTTIETLESKIEELNG